MTGLWWITNDKGRMKWSGWHSNFRLQHYESTTPSVDPNRSVVSVLDATNILHQTEPLRKSAPSRTDKPRYTLSCTTLCSEHFAHLPLRTTPWLSLRLEATCATYRVTFLRQRHPVQLLAVGLFSAVERLAANITSSEGIFVDVILPWPADTVSEINRIQTRISFLFSLLPLHDQYSSNHEEFDGGGWRLHVARMG